MFSHRDWIIYKNIKKNKNTLKCKMNYTKLQRYGNFYVQIFNQHS
jgi:hypothetical protein